MVNFIGSLGSRKEFSNPKKSFRWKRLGREVDSHRQMLPTAFLFRRANDRVTQ
jgi:hypothetical protein